MGSVEAGRVVGGRFRVVGALGEGGMAVVVEADDLQGGPPVALKVLAADASPALRARFLREARTTSKIDSPHVVRVHGVGEEASGEAFLVMERLEGGDLAARLADHGPLAVSAACAFARDAARGLAAAHASGVIHRDIKPSNLFVHRTEGGEVLKIVDFGISREVLGRTVEGDPLTETGAVLGTPHYLSPEQLVSSRRVTPATDLWSLGVTLHELLAGVPPFASDRIDELFRAILSAEPPSLRRSRPEVPEALETIVRRCLSRDADLRPSSAERLAQMLEPFTLATAATVAVESAGDASEATVLAPPEPPRQARPPVSTGTGASFAHVATEVQPPPPAEGPPRWRWAAITLLAMGASSAATWALVPPEERVVTRRVEAAPVATSSQLERPFGVPQPPESDMRPLVRAADRIEGLLLEGRDEEALSRTNNLAQRFSQMRGGTPAESDAAGRLGMMNLVLRARLTGYVVDLPLEGVGEAAVLEAMNDEISLTGASMVAYLDRLPERLVPCGLAYDALRGRAFAAHARARAARWPVDSDWHRAWTLVERGAAATADLPLGKLARLPPRGLCERIHASVVERFAKGEDKADP